MAVVDPRTVLFWPSQQFSPYPVVVGTQTFCPFVAVTCFCLQHS
jgi:hypothetical protein